MGKKSKRVKAKPGRNSQTTPARNSDGLTRHDRRAYDRAGYVRCSGTVGLFRGCQAMVKAGVDGAVTCPGCDVLFSAPPYRKLYCQDCASGSNPFSRLSLGILSGACISGSFSKCLRGEACGGLNRCRACNSGLSLKTYQFSSKKEEGTDVPNEIAPMPKCVGCDKSTGSCRACVMLEVAEGGYSICSVCSDAFCSLECLKYHPDESIASGAAPYICDGCYEGISPTPPASHESESKSEEERTKAGCVAASSPPVSNYLEEVRAAFKEGRCGSCKMYWGFECVNRCSGCRSVIYCGPECQAADWSTHKHHCKEMRQKRDKSWAKKTETNAKEAC